MRNPRLEHQRLEPLWRHGGELDLQPEEALPLVRTANCGCVLGISRGYGVRRLLGDAEGRGSLVAAHPEERLAAYLPHRHLEPKVLLLGHLWQCRRSGASLAGRRSSADAPTIPRIAWPAGRIGYLQLVPRESCFGAAGGRLGGKGGFEVDRWAVDFVLSPVGTVSVMGATSNGWVLRGS